MRYLLALLAVAVLACTSADVTGIDGGSQPTATPWIGFYSSMTETLFLGSDSVEVFLSTQLRLAENHCSVHIALSTPDPNGDWVDINSAGVGICAYGNVGLDVYLASDVRVSYPGGNYVDRFDAIYQATDAAWDTLVWITYYDVRLGRTE